MRGGKIYVCKFCGREFISNKGCKSRTPMFCSMECYAQSQIKDRDAYERRKLTEGKGKPHKKRELFPVLCKWCMKPFDTTRDGQLFCSSECYHNWQRTDEAKEPRRPKAICLYCGKEFYAHGRFKGHERKFCSNRCKNAYVWKDYKYDNWVTKKCEECGKEFTVRYGSRDKKFCCKECYNNAMVQYEEGKRVEQRNAARSRRERLTIPLPKDYLRTLNIVQDNKCIYCGEDMGMRPTIDHVLPVSAGGNNDKGNLIYCCQSCNSKKGYKKIRPFIEKFGFEGAEARIMEAQQTAIEIDYIINNMKQCQK